MSLKSVLGKYLQKPHTDVIGLGMCGDGVSFAWMSSENGSQTLKACEFFLDLDGARPLDSVKATVEKFNLQGYPCRVTLPSHLYNLLLIEAPKVPEDELVEASRWKVKDLLPYPLDEALIDVFPLPQGSAKGRNMVYAVATREAEVRSVMDFVESLGLELCSIEILELSLRNIVEQTPADDRGVCAVYLKQNKGLLTLMKGPNVYLSRQFDLAYNAGLFDELPEDQLILELQRSLDYYERQMGQVPPGTLLIGGENVTSDKISDGLKAAFSADVKHLDMTAIAGAQTMDESILQLGVPAIGAALRRGAE